MKKITVITFILVATTCIAQNFQGTALYKTKRMMNVILDSTVNTEEQKQINKILKKQFEKEYKLLFNKDQSIYKEQESLGEVKQGGVQVILAGVADVLYRNTREERYVNQNELYGKLFLIKDKAKKRKWKLENDTKKIGDYICHKATTTMEIIQFNVNIDNTTGKEVRSKNINTIVITVWYTSQIPVTHGPGDYWGLPGLILEVNDGSQIMICYQITLNSKGKLSIKEPNYGKVVTQEEYSKILSKKQKEMEKFQQNNRTDKKGKAVKITIQG